MKKVFSLVFSLALMLGLAFAQNTGGSDTGGAMMGNTGGAMMGNTGGSMSGMTFADVDTNGDGSIDQMEFDAAMGMMDVDTGGAMMGESGGAMMGNTGGAMSGMTFADYDTDGNGSIDQAEFDAMMMGVGMMDVDTGGSMMGGDTGGDSGGN